MQNNIKKVGDVDISRIDKLSKQAEKIIDKHLADEQGFAIGPIIDELVGSIKFENNYELAFILFTAGSFLQKEILHSQINDVFEDDEEEIEITEN